MSSTITDYTDKVAVVTGGASGIGRGIVEELLKAGAKVVVADIEQAAIDTTVAECSSLGEVWGVRTDVTDAKSVDALADAVYERHGVVNLLFNNAGIGAPGGLLWESTRNDWRWTFEVNVFGVVYGVLTFVPRMIASGAPGYVINTSSGNGAVSVVIDNAHYAASKAAVAALTEGLAAQLEREGTNVRASLFLPGGNGLLATGMWTSERNRPAELAREVERTTTPRTVDDIVAGAKAAGHDLKVADLNELGRAVLDQISDGVYCIQLGGNEGNATRLHERADRFGQGLNPTALDA